MLAALLWLALMVLGLGVGLGLGLLGVGDGWFAADWFECWLVLVFEYGLAWVLWALCLWAWVWVDG